MIKQLSTFQIHCDGNECKKSRLVYKTLELYDVPVPTKWKRIKGKDYCEQHQKLKGR